MNTKTKVNIKKNGMFYNYLNEQNNYDENLKGTIESTVTNLISEPTTSNRPGMLLGKIQSGKTRTFIGVMGLAYDNGYDLVIIFTKVSNALVKQTYERLSREFSELVEDDQMRIFDIMSLPTNLRKYDLSQKLAFIVKKETKNLDRIYDALFETYPDLANKRILFIDDEADFASVAYENNKESNITEMKVIAGKIDSLRNQLSSTSFLQVTATPYSLYLQPEDMAVHEHKSFQPIRPAFTELVPIHDKYVGGDMYFEKSEIEGHMASFLYQEVLEKELDVLKKQDRRRVKNNDLLTSKSVAGIRKAIVNFLVGASIRRWQQSQMGEKLLKYSFIIHTERGKAAHAWQENVVIGIEEQLRDVAIVDDELFYSLIKESYNNLKDSLSTIDISQPTIEETIEIVKEALVDEYLIISIVNSEKDVNELLDETGQLRLRSPFNIFIGGQILDRGVTIGNLIGFYYGRNPKTFQQDTVLQHSRMYGARPIEDVAVTRFYTTQKIYNVMKRMHEFDSELRNAFEKGGHQQGVVFIQKDGLNQIIPCSPNKILLSNISIIKPKKRLLPIGFQTGYKTHIKSKVEMIDKLLEQAEYKSQTHDKSKGYFLMPVDEVKYILSIIHSTLIMEDGYDWDLEEYESILDYLSYEQETELSGNVWVVTKQNRNIKRVDSNGVYENSPDTPKGEKGELRIARDIAQDIPAVILLRQNGLKENGWNGTPFWWPVIVAPAHTTPTVFAKKTIR
ncbi:Z1 domain-containing protein [Sutcliffiella deserti]|uniref:Z1 domain-containing protein n=1 Tax=Sutcliffiella deserti TaxID=2875501 RepID=UPI00295BBF26|nr:Z1 domain-containing protein [Sutcliffiella deserti]